MKVFYKKEIKPDEIITSQLLVDLILNQRQIKDKKEFLNPKSPLKISLFNFDEKYKKSFEKIITLFENIKKNNQMIVVYTDYDADGITGGAILWETLYLLGFKVMPYVPERTKEGYGFSIKGIDNVIKNFNPALIISVDHGITKIKEVRYAKKKGIKIIITDHHLKTDQTPEAEAIFHIPKLSGSGVAYFFAKEVFNQLYNSVKKQGEKNDLIKLIKLEKNFSTDYLALASIGTIADLVPLTDQSRSIVKYGLEAFSKTKRTGLVEILKQAGVYGKKIAPYEIGFIIAPRINAVGRLKHSLDALRLLCTIDNNRASKLAHQIGSLNIQRQDLVEKSVDEAKKIVDKCKLDQNKIIILNSNTWHEGIIGLIASKITEEYYRPTIILTKTDGYYKASARSITSFHITNFLRSLKSYLVDVGGHSQAAGFTIEENKLELFKKTVLDKANQLIKDKDLERVIEADLKIPLSKINLQLAKTLESLAPYGIGNPQPTFFSQGKLINAKLFGKKNQHLKILVNDINQSSTNEPLELISFNQSSLFPHLSRHQHLQIVYTLEIERWKEKEKVRGKVVKICS